VTHETEFLTWNLHNDAGCQASGGVAKWADRDDGPGALSIKQTLLDQNPTILALQEDGALGPASCNLGSVKDKVASWLSGTHDVRSTDDVSGSASGERYGIFIRKSKLKFVSTGYQKCYYNGAEVRGFLWAEIDLLADATSNHFYVLNTHFKAYGTAEASAERKSQAQCVIDWVAKTKASHPHRAHFLLGDLNSGPDHYTEAYTMLTGPGGPFENTSTASPDGINTHGDNWIDHVLGTKGDFTKVGYQSWTVGAGQVQNGGTLSDHLGLRTRIGHLK
jgi:endonuclease/exonuclease/phosphatase family metal-dependent hydrolase